VSIDTQDTIIIDGASVLSVDTLELGGVKYTTMTGGGGGNVDLSWGNNTGVLFETNDTINVSDNNYISGDDLYSTGYHYFDASDKFYISTEPASGNVMYVNNDGNNVLLFGASNTVLRSPTGKEINLSGDELRMTFDSYNFANATNNQNFVTIESASGAGRLNLLGITRPGSAFSGLVVDTNLILTSDTSIYADYIKIDSVGFTDGSWQSTAATGGGGSSSGSAGEIQFSDGSGGFDSYPGFFVKETVSTAGAFQLNNTVVNSVDSSIAYNGNFYASRFVAGTNAGGQFYLGESGFSPAFYRPTSYSGSSKKVHLSGGFSNWHTGTDAALKIISTNFNGYALEIGRSETYGTYNWRIGNYGNVDHSSGNYYLADTLEVGENVYVGGHIEADSIYVDGNVYVEGYIEADSIVLINNTYSDIAFEDGYELISIKDAVEYAYQNGNLKGMDRDGMINPVSYINDLELKIEDLYLYTYKQQLEIERLRNLIMVTFLIISVVAVSLFYRLFLK